jgi:glycosyltransferase involved in cell wall biosynthesis
MTDISLDPKERPFVTFALVAYNQEKYVREAIEGAFAQTYEPLEIILSDDCSSDRTFAIMQEMASSYRGPHIVRVCQNLENMNVAPHVLKLLREARGEYIVLAAGDDVSHSSRTEGIVDCFLKTDATGVHSCCRLIDSTGSVIEKNFTSEGNVYLRSWFQAESHSVILGATSAYSKKVLDFLPTTSYRVHNEDGLLTTAILANGLKVCFIDQELVDYRTHENSLSNSPTINMCYSSIISHEIKLSNAIESYLGICDFALNAVENSTSSEIDKTAILSRIRNTKDRFLWREMVYSKYYYKRLLAILKCQSKKDIAFTISRVFGVRIFSLVKSVVLK